MIATQSCLTLCQPMDCSLPGSSLHGILQARILKWIAISFSKESPTQGSNLGLLPFCPQTDLHSPEVFSAPLTISVAPTFTFQNNMFIGLCLFFFSILDIIY